MPDQTASPGAVNHALFAAGVATKAPLPPALAGLALLIRPLDDAGNIGEPRVLVRDTPAVLPLPITFKTDTTGKRIPIIDNGATGLEYDEHSRKLMMSNGDHFDVQFEPSGLPILTANASTTATEEANKAKAELHAQIADLFDLHNQKLLWDIGCTGVTKPDCNVWQGLTLKDGKQIKLALRHKDNEWELATNNTAGKRAGKKEILMALHESDGSVITEGVATCSVAPYASKDPKDPLKSIAGKIDVITFHVSSVGPLVFYLRRDLGIFIGQRANLRNFAGDTHNYQSNLGEIIKAMNGVITGTAAEESAKDAAAAALTKDLSHLTLKTLLGDKISPQRLLQLIETEHLEQTDRYDCDMLLDALNARIGKDPDLLANDGVRKFFIKLRLRQLGFLTASEVSSLTALHNLESFKDLKTLEAAIAVIPPKPITETEVAAKPAVVAPTAAGLDTGSNEGGEQRPSDDLFDPLAESLGAGELAEAEVEAAAKAAASSGEQDGNDPLRDILPPGEAVKPADAPPKGDERFVRSEADELYTLNPGDQINFIVFKNGRESTQQNSLLGVTIKHGYDKNDSDKNGSDSGFDLFLQLTWDRKTGLIIWEGKRDFAAYHTGKLYTQLVAQSHVLKADPARLEVIGYPNNWIKLEFTLEPEVRDHATKDYRKQTVLKKAVVQEVWMQLDIREEQTAAGEPTYKLYRNTRVGSAPEADLIAALHGRRVQRPVHEDPEKKIGEKWQASTAAALRAAENRRAFNDASGQGGNKGRLAAGAYFGRAELMAGDFSVDRSSPRNWPQTLLRMEVNNYYAEQRRSPLERIAKNNGLEISEIGDAVVDKDASGRDLVSFAGLSLQIDSNGQLRDSNNLYTDINGVMRFESSLIYRLVSSPDGDYAIVVPRKNINVAYIVYKTAAGYSVMRLRDSKRKNMLMWLGHLNSGLQRHASGTRFARPADVNIPPHPYERHIVPFRPGTWP